MDQLSRGGDRLGTGLSSANVISGSAHLSGLIVQARQVQGGIHLHQAGHPWPVPRQLPPTEVHFTNRTEEIQSMSSALTGAGHVVLALSGTAGAGKTSLAVQWLHGRGDRFAGGILHAGLRHLPGHGQAQNVLRQWLRALGYAEGPAELPELAALWRSVTAERTIATLIDGTTDPGIVPWLLPAGPGATVVTSRRRLAALARYGAVFVDVPPLDQEAALDLLTRYAGQERIAADPSSAVAIVRACGYLPLLLAVSGSTLAAHPARPLAAAAAALTQPVHHPLTAELAVTVTPALDASYTDLTPDQRRAYRLLAVLPGHVLDPATVAAALAIPVDAAAVLLDALADAHLLESLPPAAGQPQRYAFTSLTREHATALAREQDAPDLCKQMLRHLVEWMLATAVAAKQLLTPTSVLSGSNPAPPAALESFDDKHAAIAWMEGQTPNLVAVLEAAVDAGWDDLVWRLVDGFWPLFQYRHPYELWHQVHVLGRDAARRAVEADAERQMLNSGAIGLADGGRFDEALEWLQEVLAAARAAGDIRDEGQAVLGMARCQRGLGQPEQATTLLEQATQLWERCAYRRGLALVQTMQAEIAHEDGDMPTAIDLLTRAQEAFLGLDDPDVFNAVRATALLGRARAASGDFSGGVDELAAAATYFDDAGGTRWSGRCRFYLAEAHSVSHPDLARTYAVDALRLFGGFSADDTELLRQWARAT